ncbi:MAG: glycosyltransferase family 39 protein, partial [Anaerolineae bacterium]|nr:glycosyltransferase family 39 protein [Anaerolineae bacterium]
PHGRRLAPPLPRLHRLAPVMLAACLLCALLLRAWALDGQALSWDEGNNAFFAHQGIADILSFSRATLDTNPPVHRLALALWLGLLGDSALNLRLLPAVLGVASVLLVYLWGRWLGGQRLGLGAAGLAALSPMLVYYSREAKGYPFVAFFGLLALYLWSRYLDDAAQVRPLAWVLYVLAEAVACGAHYYAALLFLGQGLWLAVDVALDRAGRGRAVRRLCRWLAAQLAAVALLAPWVALTLPSAWQGARDASVYAPLGLPAYLLDVGLALSAGPYASRWAAAAATLILGAGCLSALWRGTWRRVGLLTCATLLPVLLGCAAQRLVPFFSARFLLYVAPPLLLLGAFGLSRWRRAGPALCLALAVAWVPGLWEVSHPRPQPEEDLRPLARTLRSYALPGDGVVVGYIWHEGNLRMLAPGIPVRYYLGWFTPETVERQMQDLLAAHPRLWLVTYRSPLQHPQNPAGWWLEQHGARALVTESGHGRLVLYLAPGGRGCGAMRAQFEDGIALAYSEVDAEVRTGQALLLPLCWRVEGPVSTSYSVFVHLYDQAGKLWAQNDGLPVNGLKPFPHLAPRELVADQRALWLAPELPPGHYALAVGLYDPSTGRRLKVVGGAAVGADAVTVGEVRALAGP